MLTPTITIQLNGEKYELPPEQTVQELIHHRGLTANLYLIEINEVALFRSEWETRKIQSGDRVEIIRIVAGG